MRKLRFHFIFGAAAVLAFIVCSWLVIGESSPFHDHFLHNVALPNLWRRLHTGAYIVGMILSGNVHQPSAFGLFGAAILQWFIIGFLLSFVFSGFRVRHHDAA